MNRINIEYSDQDRYQRDRRCRQRSRSKNREKRRRDKSNQRQQRIDRSKQRDQRRSSQRDSRKVRSPEQVYQQKPQKEQFSRIDKRRQSRQLDQKDLYFEDRKQIQRVQNYDPETVEKMQEDLQKKMIFDTKTEEYERIKEDFRKLQKAIEQYQRQQLTILVYCLPLKAQQIDIWNFFDKAKCGNINDIRMVRDQKSGKSLGIACVEFYTFESMQKALALKQRPIQVKGKEYTGPKIKHTQVQKAIAAVKPMKVAKQIEFYKQERQTLKKLAKIQFPGFQQKLNDLKKDDIKQIFEPFGYIYDIYIDRDPKTDKIISALVQYQRGEHADKAVKGLDGIQIIKGHKLSVSIVNQII